MSRATLLEMYRRHHVGEVPEAVLEQVAGTWAEETLLQVWATVQRLVGNREVTIPQGLWEIEERLRYAAEDHEELCRLAMKEGGSS